MEEKAKSNKKLIIAIIAGVLAIVAAVVCVVLFVDKDKDTDDKKGKDTEGVQEEQIVAATYGDITVSQEEYSYGYMSLYNQVLSVVKQYDEYYPGYGAQYYDVTLSPEDQDCPSDDLPEGVVTWADYFSYYATERAVLIKVLYTRSTSDEAIKAGFKITEEQKEEMDGNIEEFISALETEADEEDKTIDKYIAETCGYNLTQEIYEEQLKREYIAELYLSWYSEHLAENISQEDIDTYYLQNREDIDIASVRAFTVSYASQSQDGSPVYTRDEAKSCAESFLGELSDEQSFMDTAVKYAPDSMKTVYAQSSATLVANYTKSDMATVSAEMAEWMFDGERKLYDSTVVEIADNQAFFVIMLTSLPAKDVAPTSADVRHLLVEYGEDAAASKLEAESLVEQWKENGATEEAFIELVKVHTDDVASAETGGLYEGINSSSSYVPEFLNWSLEPHSKGDVEIVETTYGYHIMYYVGGDTTPKWETDIRNALAEIEYSDFYDDLYKDISENTVREDDICQKVNEENLAMILKHQGIELEETETSEEETEE